MSVLHDFTAATSLKISHLDGVLHPPLGLPDTPVSRDNVCPTKTAGDATITIMASQLFEMLRGDFPIVFQPGEISPGESTVVVQFLSNQTFNPPIPIQLPRQPEVQVSTVAGQLTVELHRVDARDENDCAGSPRRYAVTLVATTSSVRNELRVGILFGRLLPINVDINTLNAVAGGVRPAEPPGALHLTHVSLNVAARCASSSVSRVTGSVHFNRALAGTDDIVRVQVSALAISSDGIVERAFVMPSLVWVRPNSRTGAFQVQIPGDFEGRVIVTAVFGSETRTFEIEVLANGSPLCLDPDFYHYDEEFRLLDFPCPELDLTSLGHMLGWHDGLLYRKRANEPVISFREFVGGDVRRAAINEFAEVAGSTIDATGKLHGFILLAQDTSPAIVIDDMQFTAINDDGLAVGYKRGRNRTSAAAFALTRPKSGGDTTDGKQIKLALPRASHSEAVAVNNLGQIVVVATNGVKKIFLFEKGKGTEIGELGEFGTVRKLTDSGFLVGNEFTKDGMAQPFLISLAGQKVGRVEVPALKGFEHVVALDVGERGTVIGRAFTSKVQEGSSHGFRYTALRGTEDLNNLVKLGDGVVVTAALRATNRGEIVVEIARGTQMGYSLLVPKGLKR